MLIPMAKAIRHIKGEFHQNRAKFGHAHAARRSTRSSSLAAAFCSVKAKNQRRAARHAKGTRIKRRPSQCKADSRSKRRMQSPGLPASVWPTPTQLASAEIEQQ